MQLNGKALDSLNMSESMDFEEWPLHDAVLREVVVDWKNRACRIHVAAFLDRAKVAVPCTLTWTAVREVRIPMLSPWGPSVSINSQSRAGASRFQIEVQSGDVIMIEAESGRFESDEPGAV